MNKDQLTRRKFVNLTAALALSGPLSSPLLTAPRKNGTAAGARRPAEPHYLGRPLSGWVSELYAIEQINGLDGFDINEAIGCIGTPALPYLDEALRSTSERVTKNALYSLGKIGPPAIPRLVAALSDPRDYVQRDAAHTLATRPADTPLDADTVARLLYHPDPAIRGEVTWWWGSYKTTPPAAVLVLAARLSDELLSNVVRGGEEAGARVSRCFELVNALAHGGPAALDALLLAAETEHQLLYQSAVPAICRLAVTEPRAVQALRRLLSHSAPWARLGAAASLVDLDQSNDEVRKMLVAALSSNDPAEAHEAHDWFGELGPKMAEAVPAICRLLDMAEPERRGKFADLLAAIGPAAAEAVPRLIAMLEGVLTLPERPSTSLIRALGLIGEPAAVPRITQALDHPEPFVRIVAARALYRLQADSRMVGVLLENLDSDGCFSYVLGALAEIGPPAEAAVPRLTDALRKNGHDCEVYEALGAIGPASEPAIPYLLDVTLRSGHWGWRNDAARVLGGIGTRAITPLCAALADKDVNIRWAATNALGDIGTVAEPAVPALIAMLDEDDRAIQIAAAKALGRIGPAASAARGKLQPLLAFGSFRLFRTVKTALEKIDHAS